MYQPNPNCSSLYLIFLSMPPKNQILYFTFSQSPFSPITNPFFNQISFKMEVVHSSSCIRSFSQSNPTKWSKNTNLSPFTFYMYKDQTWSKEHYAIKSCEYIPHSKNSPTPLSSFCFKNKIWLNPNCIDSFSQCCQGTITLPHQLQQIDLPSLPSHDLQSATPSLSNCLTQFSV